MGWRFRTSFKVFPGARINISSRGLSATIGGSPLSFNIGSQGAHVNLSIPGTGLSYRHKLTGGGNPSPQISAPRLDPTPVPPPAALPTPPHSTPFSHGIEKQEIRSASTFELTSDALRELHRILTDVNAEQQKLDAELAIAGPDCQRK